VAPTSSRETFPTKFSLILINRPISPSLRAVQNALWRPLYKIYISTKQKGEYFLGARVLLAEREEYNISVCSIFTASLLCF